MKKYLILLLCFSSLLGFAQTPIARVKQGESFTFTLNFPSSYDTSRIAKLTAFLGGAEVGDLGKSTIVPLNDSCFRLQLRSSRTALLKGDYAFQVAVEDEIIGVKKTTPVLISFLPSNNTTSSSAVNTGSDVLVKVNILAPSVVANAELATIYKGEPGAPGPTGATGAQGPAGATGAPGPAGSDASVTSGNIASALGYTPVSPALLGAKRDTSASITTAKISDWTSAWAARWAAEAVSITSNLIPSGTRSLGGSGSGQHWNIGYISTINNQLGALSLQQGGTSRLRLLSSHVEVLSPDFYVFSTGTSAGKIIAGLGGGGALYGNTSLAFLVGGGAGTEAARFHSTGNFSLGGTTDNGEKLQVTGTSSFSSTMKLPANVDIQWGTNSFLRSDGVGTFRMGFGAGTTDAILAVNSLLSRAITGGFASGTNANGNNLTLSSQVATGTGSSGDILLQTSTPTTSGGSAQTLVTRVAIKGRTGNLGVGTTNPNDVAILELLSGSKGFLPPRMTANQASAISAVEGLMLYVTDTNETFPGKGWWGFNGTNWEKLNN